MSIKHIVIVNCKIVIVNCYFRVRKWYLLIVSELLGDEASAQNDESEEEQDEDDIGKTVQWLEDSTVKLGLHERRKDGSASGI